MDFKLNSSPHLSMDEITKQLFNRNLHSDIRFDVNGKIIHAHSLVLNLRSAVFEEELKTVDKTKVIRITNYKYDTFAVFIRYLYTNDCTFNDDNGIELLSLARKYQVISLENQLIFDFRSMNWSLSLFEYCVLKNYEFAQNSIYERIAINFSSNLNTKRFLELHPDAVKQLLQFGEIGEEITEIQIFNKLAEWIDNYCKQHHMSLTEGQQKFDSLIRKIRFGTMSIDEVKDCFKKHHELFTKYDLESITKQLNVSVSNPNELWNSKCRIYSRIVSHLTEFNRDSIFETVFTVSNDVILRGLWIGVEESRKQIEITITATDINKTRSRKIEFIQSSPKGVRFLGISLGESIRLKPNIEYKINTKYLELTSDCFTVNCRLNVDVICNGPEDYIQITTASKNMKEIVFTSVPN